LTAATAVAAAEACARAGAEGVGVKWPNDLVVGPPGRRRKLAGILAQSRVDDAETVVVVGMGLNVVSTRLGELATTAIALDELGVSVERPRLLADVLVGLDALLADLEQGRDGVLWDRYEACSATIGTEVRAELDGRVVRGRAVRVTPTGALVIENDTGRHEVVVGEVVSLR
jgi:BirA family biotin operon repressor/biotin-[acetyl-CoA-carboxylase] ligase